MENNKPIHLTPPFNRFVDRSAPSHPPMTQEQIKALLDAKQARPNPLETLLARRDKSR